MSSIGRNDPCPCGSGLKYKSCHAGKMRLSVSGRPGWLWGIVGLVVVAIALVIMRSQSRTPAPSMVMTPPSSSAGLAPPPATSALPNPVATNPAGPPITTSLPGGATPQPWQYDAATNKHFDPSPGHGHWHDGPPPPPEQRMAASAPAGATPEPWTYDAKNNQHWDPNHAHWHPGQPPPVGQR